MRKNNSHGCSVLQSDEDFKFYGGDSFLPPWKLFQLVPPKRRYLCNRLHYRRRALHIHRLKSLYKEVFVFCCDVKTETSDVMDCSKQLNLAWRHFSDWRLSLIAVTPVKVSKRFVGLLIPEVCVKPLQMVLPHHVSTGIHNRLVGVVK